MAEVDPELEAALRRLRAVFGFVEVLRIVDHEGQDQDDDAIEGDDQAGVSGWARRTSRHGMQISTVNSVRER